MSRRALALLVAVGVATGVAAAACEDDDVTLPLVPPSTTPTIEAAPSTTAPPSGDPSGAEERAIAAGRRFLDTYVAPHGRVQRHDQGDDTVSEGQAYAMLVAAAIGDESTFATVWSWTTDHLQRSDGLLAWRWHDGAVVDPEPAADADLDAAHALLLAAERFDEPAYRADALALADALHTHLTLPLDTGRLLLPGTWAVADRRWNPSYASPLAFSLLFRLGDDHRWAEVAATSRLLVDRLTAEAPHLAPDWARLGDGGPGPEGDPAVYGYDAVRLPLRFALDCDPHGVELAARAWPVLDALTDSGVSPPPAVLHLDGSPAGSGGHPAATVGASASAAAAGDDEAAARLLDLAEAQDAERPTYYGAALVALGRLGLHTGRLGGCP